MGIFRKKKNILAENTENKDSRIKVLGSGCSKCNELEENTKTALKELNLKEEISHITDFTEIMKYGEMSTPAIVIDEKVLVSGRVSSVSEMKNILKENL